MDANHSEGEGKKQTEKMEDLRILHSATQRIDRFVSDISGGIDAAPNVPEDAVDRLMELIDKEGTRFRRNAVGGGVRRGWEVLFDAIDHVSKLSAALSSLASNETYDDFVRRTAQIQQRIMTFLEEEFKALLLGKWFTGLDEGSDTVTTTSPEEAAAAEEEEEEEEEVWKRRIASSMMSAGYDTECCQAFSIVRRAVLGSVLWDEVGFKKINTEDMQKMEWEALEMAIGTWINAFWHAVCVLFPDERRLCEAVFSGHPAISTGLFTNLARGIIIQLLSFAEGVTMTPRSCEKLYKFLDMYETLRDLAPVIDDLFPKRDEQEEEEEGSLPSSLLQAELKSEMSVAKARIGESAAGIFADLENSIKSDVGKNPVPGGAVHPLTRYVMNYLQYACACKYMLTLEEVFKERQCRKSSGRVGEEEEGNDHYVDGGDHRHASPFAQQLMTIMDLMDQSLYSKSKLYRDPSLSYIFLMNNGRYVVQKLKGWPEINELLGDAWCRRRSSDLRRYHKNYQRETWGKVLGCLRDEGLHVKGGSSVLKPVLKERFKTFNAMFEEIHKTQSGWVVRDEQLKSELRVSVSAVLVPAYRSFLGRFRQHLDSGRHAGKYIKSAPEDLETHIEDFFEGT